MFIPKMLLEEGMPIEIPCPDGSLLRYEVRSTYLENQTHPMRNSEVFDLFERGNDWVKWSIASKVYGYGVDSGCWPDSREDDYEGLTQLYWLVCSWSLKPEGLRNPDTLINPAKAFQKLPYFGRWKGFEGDLPRVLSLLTKTNFLDWDPKELLKLCP